MLLLFFFFILHHCTALPTNCLSHFSVPPKRLLMYRLAPADSSAELFPLVNSGRTGESSAWRVSQLLSSITSVNSSALSYVPFGLSVPPPPLDIISASASHPIDSSNSRVSSSSTSSRRRLLQVHELTSSVLYLDEGIDTLIGCEAIGGKWHCSSLSSIRQCFVSAFV